MFTRPLWIALLTLILAASAASGHQGGQHPPTLDDCDDIELSLVWFRLYGTGIEGQSRQNPLEPQDYTIRNDAGDGYAPKATVKIGWALGSGHVTYYDDFIATISIGNSRSYIYDGNLIPTEWTIKPYIDGWSGIFTVTLQHKTCNFSMTARARWSMENPCATCPILSCAGVAEIKSVKLGIPIGLTDYGHTPVQLEYLSEQIANEGVGKLVLRGPVGDNGVILRRTGEIITSVETGDHQAAVIPDPDDPNRFSIEVSYDKNDPANTIYRQAIVENIVLPDDTPALRYTDTVAGRTDTHVFTRPDSNTWVLEDNSLRRTTKTKLSESAATRVHRFQVEEKNAAGTYLTVTDRIEHETRYTWGWEKTRGVVDPDGVALTTTWDYYDSPEFSGPYDDITGRGRLQSVTFPTGLTRSFEYHDTDQLDPSFSKLMITREAFAGSPGARETRQHSTSNGAALTERVETWVNGILVGRTDIAAGTLPGSTWRTETRYPTGDAPPAPVHVTRFDYDQISGTPLKQRTTFPDGTVEIVTETHSGGIRTTSTYRGVANPAPSGIPILTGTEDRTVISDTGQILESGSYRIRNGSAFRIEERIANTLDALSRPTVTDVFLGAQAALAFTETTEYGCCGIATRTGRDGIPTHSFYDPLGRLTKTHWNGLATETVFDGLTTRTHQYPEAVASGLSLATPATETNWLTRNLAGDITGEAARSPEDNSLVSTSHQVTYNPGNGIGQRVVHTFPQTPGDLGVPPTITREYYLDGQPAGQTGPLVANQKTTFSANAGGIAGTASLLDANGDPYQQVTTQYDWMGRPSSRTYAGDADNDGQPDRELLSYDLGNRPEKHVDPDGVTRLWSYDLLNESATVAIDLNANGLIDPDIDEVRSTRTGTGLSAENRTILWSEELIRDLPGTDTLLARRESRADGLESWLYTYGDGSTTLAHSLTTRLPTLPGAWDTTIRNPDQTTLVQHIRNGLLDTEESFDATGTSLATRSYHYDSHQRLRLLDNSNGPELEATYVSPLVDAIATRRVGTRLTSFAYDHRGRRTVVDEPDSLDSSGATVDNRRVSTWWPHGGLREVTGTPGYRLAYTYDDAHRLESLTTYGTTTATTRWAYDPDRGWLTGKLYNSPAPGQGSGPSFLHTPAGRLDQRLSQGSIITDHGYGPDGRLTRTDYSDGTPSTVILERDRRGRTTRLSDAAGERHFTYDTRSALSSEVYQPGHLLADWSIHQSRDTLARLDGLTLRSHGIDRHHSGYAYDDAGRLESVQANELTAFYHYDPDHQRVRQVSIVDDRAPVLFGSRSYDALNRLQRISYHDGNIHGSLTVFSDYKYTRDPFGRIATSTLRDKTQWRFGYHPGGEIASANRFLSAASGTPVAGHAHTWTFDGIGNRLGTGTGGDPSGANVRNASYTPNALNQFASVQRPGFAEVFGEAPAGADVTVNGATATRQGDFFRHELAPDNAAGPVWQPVAIASGSDTSSGNLLIPPAQTSLAYDPDGNLENDGIHQFSWDAENRLTGVETTPAATAAGIPYARLAYTYDSDSRRLQRLRFDSPGATTPAESTRYLYAGWRCLGELDSSGQLTRTLTWGLDNNDALHLGDGNGALLWIHDQASSETHLAHFDGNGNLTGLSSAQSRQQTAHYLYSPFGKLLAATGPYAQQNPYRFSTHHQDPATGLVDYGYRHLNPETGSWLSRDPLGEKAGVNLYGFVGNEPVGSNDKLGLALYAFDGTGNVLEQQTHIGILAGAYRGRTEYEEGVGTNTHGPLDNKIVGGITGAGGKARMESMYKRFQANYANGDKNVDIVGFSRGASLARAFANLLYTRGFIDPVTGKCAQVKIRFIGLFDTVGSFGAPGNGIDLGYNLDIPPNVKWVAHALARDEKRALFPLTPLNKPRPDQHFFELAFPGDHSDIGGGHSELKNGRWVSDNRILSKAPLKFIHFSGVIAEAPFGPLPKRNLINSRQPHDLSTKPSGILGPFILGTVTDKFRPSQPRNLPDGLRQW